MLIKVLGSAAGGGFPQWNCGCVQCTRARAGDPAVRPRTQSSIMATADGKRWVLVNASPDLGKQINDTPALHPRTRTTNGDGRPRHSPIAAVLVTNADVDHVAGLLTLRESQAFSLYATARVQGILGRNSIFNVLNPAHVERREVSLSSPIDLVDATGEPLGLEAEIFAVPGKIALWLEDPTKANLGSQPEDTVGLRLRDQASGQEVFYIPGCADLPPALADRINGAKVVLFDGTTFTNAEMHEQGVGEKTAQRMGHLAMHGPEGSMAAFSSLDVGRRIYVHINNTNPVLCEDSPERAAVVAAGWEVAFDGMEITP